MRFPIPKDWRGPDTAKDGTPFKQLVTLSLDGKDLVLRAIGDLAIGDEDEGFVAAVKRGNKKMKEAPDA